MAFPQLLVRVSGHQILVITERGCRSGCKQVGKAEAGATSLRRDRSEPVPVQQCRACGFRHTLHLTRGLNLSSCQGTSFVNRKMSPGSACPSWLQGHCLHGHLCSGQDGFPAALASPRTLNSSGSVSASRPAMLVLLCCFPSPAALLCTSTGAGTRGLQRGGCICIKP